MSQLFEIGRSAIRSYQTALNVVGQNLANVETPGYARQRAHLVTRDQMNGSGSGVNVISIERLADRYAQLALRDAAGERGAAEVRTAALSRLDELLSDPATGLAEPLRDLLGSSSALTANPTDIPTRQQFLAASDTLVARLQTLDARLREEAAAARQEIDIQVSSINDQLQELARIESTLSRDAVNTDTSNSNLALRDRRDQILDSLAETAGFSAQIGNDGRLRLSLPNGQAVLSEGQVSPVGLGSDVYGSPRLTVAGLAVSDEAFGGRIAGLVQLLDSDLPAARDQLAQIGAGLSLTLNAVQTQGVDLDGNPAAALINNPAPAALAASTNTGSAALAGVLDTAATLPAQRFELRFDGLAWSATDALGGVLGLSGAGTPADPLQVGGLELVVSGVPLAGDRFEVRPATLDGLESTGLTPRQLATAAAGSPPGSANNDNARALFDALSGGVLDGGDTSLQDAQINWVASIGGAAQAASQQAASARALEQGAMVRVEQAQGVSLDEEAADLLRYEQAYAAAAQVLATADDLFQTILGAVRN